LHDSTKKQLEILDNEMNNIISIIKKQRDLLEEKIKNNYKTQIEQIDNSKMTINQNLSNLSQIMANTLRMIQKLESIILLTKTKVIFIMMILLKKKNP
jgi:UDP-N-acetylglucosamine:LPS N-acetylglucosamine transferase